MTAKPNSVLSVGIKQWTDGNRLKQYKYILFPNEVKLSFTNLLVLYFRDSLLITVLLLLNCIAIQGLSQCGYEVPNWVNSSTDYLKSNKMGQVFFSNNYLVERASHSIIFKRKNLIFIVNLFIFLYRNHFTPKKPPKHHRLSNQSEPQILG